MIARTQGRFVSGFSRGKADILDDLLRFIDSGEPADIETLEEAHSAIVNLRLQKNRLLVNDATDVPLTGNDDVVSDLNALATRLPSSDAGLVRDGIAEILRHRSLL